jgi:transposase
MPRATELTRSVNRQRIAALLRREVHRRLRERLQALWWLSEGLPAVEVAAKLGRCRQTVAVFVERYNAQGLRGLRQVGRGPGRQATVHGRHRKTLARWIREGPRACGYGVNLWTCKLLAHHVSKQWGLTLSDESVRRTLHQLGAHLLRPRHQLPVVPAWRRREKNGTSDGS